MRRVLSFTSRWHFAETLYWVWVVLVLRCRLFVIPILLPNHCLPLPTGQTKQWHIHHKLICKNYTKFTASPAFQFLQIHERNDSLLLSHLLAHLSLLPTPYEPEDSSPLSIFLSLLPSPVPDISVPPLCPISPTPSLDLVRTLYTRFGNNNFAIHSHLTTIGHGVFPLASRLFNHSCVPNAAARYSLSPSHGVGMEVIAIRDIPPGEEVTHSTVSQPHF